MDICIIFEQDLVHLDTNIYICVKNESIAKQICEEQNAVCKAEEIENHFYYETAQLNLDD